MKELVFFDIDNTLIDGYSQQIFLKYLFKKKIIKLPLFIRINAWFIFYKIGIIKDTKKVMEYSYKFLKNWKVSDFKTIVDEFFKEKLEPICFKDMISIVNDHKMKDRELILISNVIDPIVQKIGEYFGINNYLCTKLEIVDEKFTGNIIGDVIYGERKKNSILDFLRKNNYTLDNSWGYGDHISDLPFLNLVRNHFVVNPNFKMSKIAKKNGWKTLIFKRK